MKYNTEMEGTRVIQILRLEDTGFGSETWEIVAMKSFGPGMVEHAFNPRKQRQADFLVQSQPGTQSKF